MTPREQAAWEVAHAALAAAYDVTVRETFIDFHEQFPKVRALTVFVGPETEPHRGPEAPHLPLYVWCDTVRLAERTKSRHEVKPENATAVDAFLTHRLCSFPALPLPVASHIKDAIYRATSDDGLIWIENFTGEAS